MKVLNGWKEIGECLHRTPRSARRWERLGLPVWRISDGARSPVVADKDEIEFWVRRNRPDAFRSLASNTASFRATRHETQKLLKQLREARLELRTRLAQIENQAIFHRFTFGPGGFPDNGESPARSRAERTVDGTVR